MSFFKILIGFTVLNVFLQVVRGNPWLELLFAVVIFVMAIFAEKLWRESK